MTAESIFIEIKSTSSKNIIIGCLYRHHEKITDFIDNFLVDILAKLRKDKNKTCILMGDFNIDLLKIGDHDESCRFYEILSENGFRPLILQPSRVTGKSSTLIDNIFINSLEIHSNGGNITSSISDHFSQFCEIDIFKKSKKAKSVKYGRSYKNFVQDEFDKEVKSIQWDLLF